MAAAIEPLEAGRDRQPIAGGSSLGVVAEDATRDALERAELAAAVQEAMGLPAVLHEAAWHVDPAGGGADLVLAQAQAADGPRGGGAGRGVLGTLMGELPLIWNGVHGSAARELEHMAGDPRFTGPEAAHLGEAAALAAEHPLRAPVILERALDNLAVGLDSPRRVELLRGDPLGPQALPGRTIEEPGPQVAEGPTIPDDQGPQVLPGPTIEAQGPQVQASPVPDPQGPAITWRPTVPKQDEIGDGVVVMADPNNPKAVRTQKEAADRMRTAFPEAVVREEVQFGPRDRFGPGDIDILVDNIPIEVTSGGGGGKQAQLPKVSNAAGQDAILYAPWIGGTVDAKLKEMGYEVVRTLDDLEAAVRARMEDQDAR